MEDNNLFGSTTKQLFEASPDGGRSGGEKPRSKDNDNDVAKGKDERRRLASRRRELDRFYARIAGGLPKATQEELHRNRFLVRDVIAAVRSCFETGGFGVQERGDHRNFEAATTEKATPDAEGQVDEQGENTKLDVRKSTQKERNKAATIGTEQSIDSAEGGEKLNWGSQMITEAPRPFHPTTTSTVLLAPAPRTFNLAVPSSHQAVLDSLLGIVREIKASNDKSRGVVVRQRAGAAWNWERLPQTAANAGCMRGMEAVPWRTDEEISELIKQEKAQADDLAGGCAGCAIPLHWKSIGTSMCCDVSRISTKGSRWLTCKKNILALLSSSRRLYRAAAVLKGYPVRLP